MVGSVGEAGTLGPRTGSLLAGGMLSSILRSAPGLGSLAVAVLAYHLVASGLPNDLLCVLLIAAVCGGAALSFPSRLGAGLPAVAALLGVELAAGGRMPSVAIPLGVTGSAALMAVIAHCWQRAARRAAAATAAVDEHLQEVIATQAAVREPQDIATSVLAAARSFMSTEDPAHVTERIAQRTVEHLHGAGVVLLLWDETLETFRVGAVEGTNAPGTAELRQVEVRPDRISTLRRAAPGQVVRVDLATWREPLLEGLLRRWHADTVLGVRLQRGDRLLGLLFVAGGNGRGPFTARDEETLSGIALHASAALSYVGLLADLQAASTLKEEFMATMSHELRTPLNVILGYTELQLDGTFGDLAPEQLDTVQRIRGQAIQLLELIQATLDMSRLERGLMTVDLRDISILHFMEQLHTQIPPEWRKNSVDLKWRTTPGVPPIRTDPAKLQIILRNLIQNALKFTHQGVVTVSVVPHPSKPSVIFTVQDSGVGIKAEHLSDIFEMFRQVPASQTTPVSGVGLGLYIVKRLAGVIGAEIEVRSAPGRGATFRIHVPVDGPLALAAPQALAS